jgi:hypothetical protein
VFILGAGASYQCGAPLMGNFLDVATNLLWSNKVDDKRGEFNRVFEAVGALQAVHSKAQLDLNNIESIFTVLELGRIIQKVPNLSSQDIPLAISALKDLIVKTLEVTIKFPTDENQQIGIPKPYDKFADLLKHLHKDAFPPQTAAVISFNYDIAADMAMYRTNLGPDYIIGEQPNWETPRLALIPLLKLHGSLNWATVKETRKIQPLHLSEYFQQHKYSYSGYGQSETDVPIGSRLFGHFKCVKRIAVVPEPVIVPPSWNKADYHSALSDVWASAATHLSEAEQIFIIGYSLPETDSFFRHLYALGSVGAAPLRRIAVFNPDTSGATDKRFQALLGPGARARYEYHTIPFDQAIDHIKKLFVNRS